MREWLDIDISKRPVCRGRGNVSRVTGPLQVYKSEGLLQGCSVLFLRVHHM